MNTALSPPRASTLRRLHGTGHVLEQASRLLEKDRTGRRQCHTAAIALEEPDPHLLLQSADLTA
jgi:hypothetical protein